MQRALVVPAVLLALAATGCAKQPASMPPSASASAPSAGTAATSRPVATTASPTAAAAAGTSRPTAAPAANPAGARPAPRDFTENAALKDINFDFDKYDIRPADTRNLDANAAWLKSNPKSLLLIEGHTDERGTPEYNLALGERRAKAAMSYLVALGIPANRISIISYGEEHGLCKEHSEPCWAKNRRDHFLVKPE